MYRGVLFSSLLAVTVVLHSCNGCGGKKPIVSSAQKADTLGVKTQQVDSISKLIAAQPNKAELYISRSRQFVKTNSFDAALKDVAKAIELDPKNPEYYLTESDIYFLQKDLVRAINALEQGNTAVPENKEILLALGRYYYYKTEDLKALNYLNHLLKIDPSVADAYFLRGQVYKETGDTVKAIADYQNVIEHSPKYYDAYMELGLLKAAKKDKSALDYYNNALKIDSGSMEARYGIAMYYQSKKDYPKAIELYRKMVIDTPQYELPYYNLGYIYFQMDSLQKADRNFEIATSVKPEYADAYYMRGLVAEAIGDKKKAQFFYDQTLKLDAKHPGAIQGFGRLRNQKQ